MSADSPAAWMDRLSDGIGAFIPGGTHWPPRHPIKVSVVMGLLGLASGWLTMAIGMAISLIVQMPRGPEQEHIIFFVAGGMQAALVLAPWGLWLGLRRRWFIVLLPCTFLANFGCFELVDSVAKDDPVTGLFLFGFLSGLYLSVAGQCVIQRARPFWMLSTALICAAGTSFFLLMRDRHWFNSFLPQQLEMPLVIAWFFSNLHTPSAVCMGFLLWDRTPPPRFAPEEEPEGM